MDIWNKEKRSQVMSHIHSKNTKPEIAVRSLLHRMGYRYRLHRRELPGCPDIVLPKYNSVIFVHGCFWHLHEGCRDGTVPKTQHEKWKLKLERNVERDQLHYQELQKTGWKVLVIWECEIEKQPDMVRQKIVDFLAPVFK
ncbi:MAG: Very short patch repair protein [Pelotomaculum sp. PtaU1.Bin035]|nr:MAG: Very short patch repair protein [Pelotomaculum sp. PtaU1.Bin035]